MAQRILWDAKTHIRRAREHDRRQRSIWLERALESGSYCRDGRQDSVWQERPEPITACEQIEALVAAAAEAALAMQYRRGPKQGRGALCCLLRLWHLVKRCWPEDEAVEFGRRLLNHPAYRSLRVEPDQRQRFDLALHQLSQNGSLHQSFTGTGFPCPRSHQWQQFSSLFKRAYQDPNGVSTLKERQVRNVG
jgi:hypothetical protein